MFSYDIQLPFWQFGQSTMTHFRKHGLEKMIWGFTWTVGLYFAMVVLSWLTCCLNNRLQWTPASYTSTRYEEKSPNVMAVNYHSTVKIKDRNNTLFTWSRYRLREKNNGPGKIKKCTCFKVLHKVRTWQLAQTGSMKKRNGSGHMKWRWNPHQSAIFVVIIYNRYISLSLGRHQIYTNCHHHSILHNKLIVIAAGGPLRSSHRLYNWESGLSTQETNVSLMC